MRTSAAILLIFLTLSINSAFTTLRRESCSCEASDGSCSASVKCRYGCMAVCPGNGNCRAICLKGFTVKAEPEQTVSSRMGGEDSQKSKEDVARLQAIRRALLGGEKIAVCFSRVPAGELAGELSYLTGLDIKVEAKDAGTIINHSGKGVTFSEILMQVSKLSGVQFSIK